jgi:hypothetical protein
MMQSVDSVLTDPFGGASETIGVADLVRTHILSKNHRLPGAPKDVKARCRAFVARGGTSET